MSLVLIDSFKSLAKTIPFLTLALSTTCRYEPPGSRYTARVSPFPPFSLVISMRGWSDSRLCSVIFFSMLPVSSLTSSMRVVPSLMSTKETKPSSSATIGSLKGSKVTIGCFAST